MAVPTRELSPKDFDGHSIINALLERVKLARRDVNATAGDLFREPGEFPSFVNDAGIDVPLHDNSINSVDSVAPLRHQQNGRSLQLIIDAASASGAGVMSAAQYSLIQAVLDAGGTIVFQDAAGNVTLPGTLNVTTIDGLAQPATGTQAANRDFVLQQIQIAVSNAVTGFDVKDTPVRVALDENVPLTSTFGTFGGVAIAAEDANKSILLLGQINAFENGPYDITANGLARRSDSNTAANFTSGATYRVQGGEFANSYFTLITPDPFVLGTDGLAFIDLVSVKEKFPGNGISADGATWHVGGTLNRVRVLADSVDIDPAYDAEVDSKIQNAFATNNSVSQKIFTVGNGAATSFTITHNFGQRFPVAQAYYHNQPFDLAITDRSDNSFTFTASLNGGANAVEENSITIVVHAMPAIAADNSGGAQTTGTFIAAG